MPSVSVHIATWNSKRTIRLALESLKQQTFKDFSILIVDNASQDGTVALLKEQYPHIHVIQNSYNRGFAGAHNQAIHFSKSDYILMLNDDAVLADDHIETLVTVMESDGHIGSAEGLVLKLIGDPDELTEDSYTSIIDTAGIRAQKSRRFSEIGAGLKTEEFFKDSSSNDSRVVEVFGVSGAIPMYRRSALDDVRIGNEYFDDDYNSYKEDIDMAWRLRLREWKSVVVYEAQAYHYRTAADQSINPGNFSTLKNRLSKSERVNVLSSRNHLWTLVKNEQTANVIRHMPWICWYEIRKWGMVLLLEQRTLKALTQFFKGLPKMLQKRKIIQQRATASPKEIRMWFK